MLKQKIIITKCSEKINALLENDWQVVSVTAQHVSHASTTALTGEFCFVLERKIFHSNHSIVAPNPYLGPEI